MAWLLAVACATAIIQTVRLRHLRDFHRSLEMADDLLIERNEYLERELGKYQRLSGTYRAPLQLEPPKEPVRVPRLPPKRPRAHATKKEASMLIMRDLDKTFTVEEVPMSRVDDYWNEGIEEIPSLQEAELVAAWKNASATYDHWSQQYTERMADNRSSVRAHFERRMLEAQKIFEDIDKRVRALNIEIDKLL